MSIETRQHENGICELILDRPEKHNAFDDKSIAKMTAVLHQLQNDDACRIILIKSSSENFCAGADIEWMKRMADYTAEENEADAMRLAQFLQTLDTISKPTIALAQGWTVGGGLGVLACCDIVLSDTNAKFCFSEVKLGLIPATITPYVMQKIGASQTRYCFLTAKTFDAAEAKNMHLVHDIISDDLHTAGFALAKNMLKNGPMAMSACKQQIASLQPVACNHLEKTAKLIADIRVSEEGQEGLRAFLEKRQAAWIVNDKED